MTRTQLPKLQARPRPADCPVSIAQGPWLEPDNLPVHEQWLPVVWRLEGPLDVRAFLAAFQELGRRHEILRTRYARSGKSWVQAVGSDEVQLRPIDMTETDPAIQELLIWERLKVIYDTPVSLEWGAVRLEFFKLGPDRYLLAGFLHHVATDNISIGIFFNELMDGYLRRVSGADPAPPPKFQYADFTLWEAAWLKSGGRTEAAKYWKKALANATPFQLPGGRGRRGPPTAAIGQSFDIPPETFALVRQRAANLNSTMSIMFYAALSLALAKWSKRDQVLLGAFTHGRPPGFGGVMGCFMQLRPFFLDLSGNPRLSTVLERSREAAIAVSDFRRPAENEAMDALGVGAAMVNYVRRSRQRGEQVGAPGDEWVQDNDSPPSAVKEPAMILAGPAERPLSNDGAAPLSVSKPDVAYHGEGLDPWRRSPSFDGSTSLNMVGRGRQLGLRVGMSQLPRRLQPYFSRDLHVGVLETNDGLATHVTTGKDGLDPARVVTMMTDVVSFLNALAASDQRRMSDLLR